MSHFWLVWTFSQSSSTPFHRLIGGLFVHHKKMYNNKNNNNNKRKTRTNIRSMCLAFEWNWKIKCKFTLKLAKTSCCSLVFSARYFTVFFLYSHFLHHLLCSFTWEMFPKIYIYFSDACFLTLEKSILCVRVCKWKFHHLSCVHSTTWFVMRNGVEFIRVLWDAPTIRIILLQCGNFCFLFSLR